MSERRWTTLALALVVANEGTQSRASINEAAVQAYARIMRDGLWDWDHDPPVVFYDAGQYYLADGHHRIRAMVAAGAISAPFDIRSGTVRDAVLHSLTANRRHGAQRTEADIARAVDRILADPEWSGWGDTKIAKTLDAPLAVVLARRNAAQIKLDLPTAPADPSPARSSAAPSVRQPPPVDGGKAAAPVLPVRPAPIACDAEGATVPNDRAAVFLEWRKRAPEISALLEEAHKRMSRWPAADRPQGIDGVTADLGEIARRFQGLAPHLLCTTCLGAGGECCNHAGYTTA